MLKPMKPKQTLPKNIVLWVLVGVLVLAGIIVLITAFNGGGENSVDEVNAVYTNAAETLAVQQLTLQASLPSATATILAPQTPTATFIPLPSPTLFTSPVLVTNTVSAPSGAVGCNNSAYVSDVTFPDDTAVTPGQTFTKTWKLSNTGSCPWTTSYKVSFVSGNAMGGVATPLTITVAPGASGDISVAMTAPATAGDAIGYWILTNDSGQNFGSSFYVKVKVGGTTSTGGTATATGVVAKPSSANNPTITLSCALGGNNGNQYEHAGTLNWEDTSNNETGFKIYINGTLAFTTSANATSYVIPSGTFYDAGTVSSFDVEAFNAGGSAAKANVTDTCP